MEFAIWLIIIIFVFTLSLILNRYERKIKLFKSHMESMKADIDELKEIILKNRMLIEKNRSNIETISKKQEKN